MFKRNEFGKDVHGLQFESIRAMVTACLAGELPPSGHGRGDYVKHYDSSMVDRRFDSWEDCMHQLEEYDNELAERLGRMASRINTTINVPKGRKRHKKWSDEIGDELCVERLHNAAPMLLTTERRMAPKRKVVTLITNVSSSASVSPEDIGWRIAAALCVCDALEAKGYSVKLIVGCKQARLYGPSKSRFNQGLITTCLAKQPAEPLDKMRLGNIASAWSYRTLWFRCRCTRDRGSLLINQSFGGSKEFMIAELKQIAQGAEFISLPQDCFNEQDAIRAANAAIKSL